MNRHNLTLRMIISALMLALTYVLPFLTGQVPEIGAMLCPMHIPVLLCGFICGWQWGLSVGFIAPLLRGLTLGMPPIFPAAICMAFELAAYGAVSGFMHRLLPRRRGFLYLSLLISMILGRLVWGFAMFVSLGVSGGVFTLSAFIAGAITNAIPGIILQIIIIPVAVMITESKRIIKFDAEEKRES